MNPTVCILGQQPSSLPVSDSFPLKAQDIPRFCDLSFMRSHNPSSLTFSVPYYFRASISANPFPGRKANGLGGPLLFHTSASVCAAFFAALLDPCQSSRPVMHAALAVEA